MAVHPDCWVLLVLSLSGWFQKCFSNLLIISLTFLLSLIGSTVDSSFLSQSSHLNNPAFFCLPNFLANLTASLIFLASAFRFRDTHCWVLVGDFGSAFEGNTALRAKPSFLIYIVAPTFSDFRRSLFLTRFILGHSI